MSESKKGIYAPRYSFTIDGIKKLGYEWKKEFNCKNQFDLIDNYLATNYDKVDDHTFKSKQTNFYKFEESYLINGKWKIESEYGYSDIVQHHKTVPYPIWYVKTVNYEIKVADKHQFETVNNKKIFADNLVVGDFIMTKNGLEPVIEVYFTGNYENTYSPTVNNIDNSYFANGIKNFNTTIVGCYIAHFLVFNKDKTIAVLANKMQGAIEIVDRVKMIIEGLPDFLKPGIKNYNKKTIELENGCKLLAAATSPSAVRGLAINCTDGENLIEIRDTVTGEVETISFHGLYNRLLLESSDLYNDIEKSVILGEN